jgi:hypothetical protein
MSEKMTRYRYRGYFAFRVMADLHTKLFPEAPGVDGASRKAAHIFRALDKAYTDGVEDTLQQSDEWIAKQRKRIAVKERDV